MKPILLILVFSSLLSTPVSAQYWSTPGTGIPYGDIKSSVIFNDELYVGGWFDSAGNVAASRIAKWNGSTWSALGSGIYGDIYCMAEYNGSLYVGGVFDVAGGILVMNIARWDGSTWSDVGGGMDSHVYSLAVYNGELYAGGYFSYAGTTPASSIAKWNGSAWSAVGEGFNDVVISLLVHQNKLYAGGSFTHSGNLVTNFIASWNGSAWSPVGTGMDYSVLCLTVFENNLHAAGWFSMAGDSSANQIAKWDGTNWSALGTGLTGGYFGWGVQSIAVHHNALYAGGEFTYAGGVPVSNIAKWDGNNWSSPGTGANHYVFTLCSDDSTLYAGGLFDHVNESIQANRIAEWRDYCTLAPDQPAAVIGDSIVCQGYSMSYYVAPVNGTNYYTWSLPAGWTGTSTTNTIDVTAGQTGGNISVTASNSCGTSQSQSLPVAITTIPSQPGVINGDSSVCAGSSHVYSVNAVPGATNYVWILPPGWTGIITGNFVSATAGINGGNISVFVQNACGNSVARSLPVTVISIPNQPGAIIGSSSVCEGSMQSYSINPVPGATSYSWFLPAGWPGNSSTTSIVTTAGTNDGFVFVSANNQCGNSPVKNLPVNILRRPAQPGPVNGNTTVCANTEQIYVGGPVTGATNYSWIIPAGWVISGTTNSTSITVFTATNSGTIKFIAKNSCGDSSVSELPVSIEAIPVLQPEIAGQDNVQAGNEEQYSVNNLPGLIYIWTLSGGGEIPGSVNGNSVSIRWKTPGKWLVSVRATAACGLNYSRFLTVDVTAPDTKDPFSLKLFPNPTSGEFIISGKRLHDKVINVNIWNMSGQMVYESGSITGSVDFSKQFDIRKLSRGIYTVKIVVNKLVFFRNLVKPE